MAQRDLERYYDRNTGLFLRLGSSGPALALHRGLWGPGVRNGREAASYIHRLITKTISNLLASTPRTVLDLGCGVGGTLFDLATEFPDARLTGVTLSARQVKIATELAQARGLGNRCSFVKNDFEDVHLATKANVILAIESFTHSARPDRFLATCCTHLAEGGLLIVVDDFLDRDPATMNETSRVLVDTFRSGWNLPALGTWDAFVEQLAAARFHPLAAHDLSALIRTDRPRDRIVACATPIARRLGLMSYPFWANVIGGDALARAIRGGQIHYRMVVAGRSAGSGSRT